MRRILAVLVLMILAAGLASGGSQNVQRFMLFSGTNNADSSEAASRWISVEGANRVYIRIWSIGATADTNFCDSLSGLKVLLSDSICCVVTGGDGFATGSAADSVVIGGTVVSAGDSVKFVGFYGAPLTKPLRASATGSGRILQVFPIASPGTITPDPNSNAIIGAKYLRIRYTPTTRLTTAGFSSTAGLRTIGVHGMKMEASVVRGNR